MTQTDEERALCLYVRALTDERIPAARCFATLSPFPPPPPPTPQSTLAAIQNALRRAQLRRGGTSGPEPTPSRTEEEEYINQHVEQNHALNALLDRLSAENFQLRDALREMRPKLSDTTATSGRRLFERLAGTGTHSLEQSIKTSELSVGNGALLGLTVAQCSTLCTALKNETDAMHSCNGIMFRFSEPDNAANLQTAYCYLLKVPLPSAHPSTLRPSVDRRPTTRARHRTLADVSPWNSGPPSFLAETPPAVAHPTRATIPLASSSRPIAPTCASSTLPLPSRPVARARALLDCLDRGRRSRCVTPRSAPLHLCTLVWFYLFARRRVVWQAFSMVGYARERGVYSFWAEKPTPHPDRQLTHWSGLDGKPFYYPGNHDKRCILISTESENIHGFMCVFCHSIPRPRLSPPLAPPRTCSIPRALCRRYARMEPCSGRMADGVICESGFAAPPPPPDGGVSVTPPPTPPPPPIAVVASMRDFIKKEVRPRTEAICLSGLVDSDLATLCAEFATALAKSSRAGVIGAFMP